MYKNSLYVYFAHCFSHSHWASLRKVWLYFLCSFTIRYLYILTKSPQYQRLTKGVPDHSASCHVTSVSVPSSSWWPFPRLSLVCPCLSCTGEFRTGPSTPASLTSAKQRGSVIFPDPLMTLFLM